jgi:hypothetical protein
MWSPLSLVVGRPRRGAALLPQSSAGVKDAWSCTSSSPLRSLQPLALLSPSMRAALFLHLAMLPPVHRDRHPERMRFEHVTCGCDAPRAVKRQNVSMSPVGLWNQDSLCWRGPIAIYQPGSVTSRHLLEVYRRGLPIRQPELSHDGVFPRISAPTIAASLHAIAHCCLIVLKDSRVYLCVPHGARSKQRLFP